MAKNNPGDILTCDWNPVIGCERYSAGCLNCWYLEGIFPWQRRLGNIPAEVRADEHHVFQSRMSEESLRAKSGIVGVVQHGDLFWDKVPDETILRVLSIVERAAAKKRRVPKYVLWTKRAGRMARILSERYTEGLPPWLAAAVSVENQAAADERLPQLDGIRGRRIIVVEPMLGPVVLGPYLPVEWVVVGSETGEAARPVDLGWVRSLRDETKGAGIPFFLKQLGASHKEMSRTLDGREWNEFPRGFAK